MKLDVFGGFYESQSTVLSSQQLINAYVQTPQTESPYSENVIFGTPGIVERANTGTTAVTTANHGSITMAGLPYFVMGAGGLGDDQELLSMSAGFGITNRGTLVGFGESRISLAQNGTQLMALEPGGDGYIWDVGASSFLKITDGDFTGTSPQYVTYIDGYFVCSTATPNAKRFIISAINDGLTWDALDFGSAEGNPDNIIAPWEFRDRLYIFGASTFETFTNIGGAEFPFAVVKGSLQNVGLSAPFTLVNSPNFMYWLGGPDRGKVSLWRSNGQAPEKISTPAIDFHIQQFSEEDLGRTYSVYESLGGNSFIGFHFPTGEFVYDETNGKWHQRITYTAEVPGPHRVASITEAFGKLFVGDIVDGRIGEIVSTVNTEYTETVLRTLISAPFNMDQNPFFLPRLDLTMDTSAFTTTTTGDDVISVALSLDGGTTFGASDTATLGPVVDFVRRVGWRRKGKVARSVVFNFVFNLDEPFIIVRLDAKIKPARPVFSVSGDRGVPL